MPSSAALNEFCCLGLSVEQINLSGELVALKNAERYTRER